MYGAARPSPHDDQGARRRSAVPQFHHRSLYSLAAESLRGIPLYGSPPHSQPSDLLGCEKAYVV